MLGCARFQGLLRDLVAELLLPDLLDDAFADKLLLVVVDPSKMVAHVIIVLLFVLLHLSFVPPLGLLHDGGFHWVRVLHDAVILVGLQIGAVEEVLHGLVLGLVVSIWHALLLVEVTDLVMRPGQVALVSVLLRLLVTQETLQVILQLVIHFVPLPLDALRAYEREVRQLVLAPVPLLARSILLMLLGLHVKVGLVDVLQLLPTSHPLPLVLCRLQGG